MTDPTINWCPPTTNCFPYGGAANEWAVDYSHGNPFPTVDPFCPAFAPAGVTGQMATRCGADTAFSPLPAAFPPSFAGPACLPPPTILNCPLLPGPPASFFICPAPQAQASPDAISTLPPVCFGAAAPGHAGAVNGVQSLPPACFGAAPHALDQQPSIPGFFGCPVSIDPSCQSPSTVPGVFGCPVIPSAAGGSCVFSVGCSGDHVLAQGVTTLPPHCFGAAAVPAGIPPTKVTSGCPSPQVQAPPAPARAGATFAAFIDCGPTLGSPCTHPTQAGPACGMALTAPPAATAPPVCAPPTLAGCPEQTLAGCPPTQPPACPPPTLANCQAATAPQTAYFFCIQPSVNFCPPPSNVQCPPVPPTWLACTLHGAVIPPDAGSYSPNTYDPSCGSPPFHPLCMPGFPTSNPPYYTKPSICAPPTLSLECLGQNAAFTPATPRPTLTDGCPPTQTYQCVFWPTAFPCQ